MVWKEHFREAEPLGRKDGQKFTDLWQTVFKNCGTISENKLLNNKYFEDPTIYSTLNHQKTQNQKESPWTLIVPQRTLLRYWQWWQWWVCIQGGNVTDPMVQSQPLGAELKTVEITVNFREDTLSPQHPQQPSVHSIQFNSTLFV